MKIQRNLKLKGAESLLDIIGLSSLANILEFNTTLLLLPTTTTNYNYYLQLVLTTTATY